MRDFLDYLTEISGGDTRADFARAAGVSPSTVTRWDRSRPNWSFPKAEHVVAIARHYGRSEAEALKAAGITSGPANPEELADRVAADMQRRARRSLHLVSDKDLVAELQRRLARTSDPSPTMAGQEDPDAYDLAAGTVARPDDQPAD